MQTTKTLLAGLLRDAERELGEVRRKRRCIWATSSSYYWQARGEEGALVGVVKALKRRMREAANVENLEQRFPAAPGWPSLRYSAAYRSKLSDGEGGARQ